MSMSRYFATAYVMGRMYKYTNGAAAGAAPVQINGTKEVPPAAKPIELE
jgi:hypothetical protein